MLHPGNKPSSPAPTPGSLHSTCSRESGFSRSLPSGIDSVCLCDWLISLCIVSSGLIRIVARDRNSFLLKLSNTPLLARPRVVYPFIIHLWTFGLLYLLAIVTNATKNMGIHLWGPPLSSVGYIPRSEIAASFFFLKNCLSSQCFRAAWIIHRPLQQTLTHLWKWCFVFLNSPGWNVEATCCLDRRLARLARLKFRTVLPGGSAERRAAPGAASKSSVLSQKPWTSFSPLITRFLTFIKDGLSIALKHSLKSAKVCLCSEYKSYVPGSVLSTCVRLFTGNHRAALARAGILLLW